ncbi:MAG: hypothetical protein SGARI_004493, partial [Bacillariaceae sp.]
MDGVVPAQQKQDPALSRNQRLFGLFFQVFDQVCGLKEWLVDADYYALAATCRAGERTVEDIYKQSFQYHFKTTFPNAASTEAVAFLKRMNRLEGHCCCKMKGKNLPLSHRWRMWALRNTALYYIEQPMFDDTVRFTQMANTLDQHALVLPQISIGEFPVYDFKNKRAVGIFQRFGVISVFDTLQKRRIGRMESLFFGDSCSYGEVSSRLCKSNFAATCDANGQQWYVSLYSLYESMTGNLNGRVEVGTLRHSLAKTATRSTLKVTPVLARNIGERSQ